MANTYRAVLNSGSKRTASTVDAAKGRGGYEVGCCYSTSRAGEGGIDGCGSIAGWGGERVRGCSVEGGGVVGYAANGQDWDVSGNVHCEGEREGGGKNGGGLHSVCIILRIVVVISIRRISEIVYMAGYSELLDTKNGFSN
jgi:hypothetical protein